MNIKPGIGIGSIKYGINEEELSSIFGTPDKIEEQEYIPEKGDWSRDLWYSPRNVFFTFDKENDYRLGTITIMGSGYPLFGKELFGLPLSLVRKFITEQTKEIAKYEDFSTDLDEPHECLTHDGLGITFWFDSGNLSEMQCSFLFESDNETEIVVFRCVRRYTF